MLITNDPVKRRQVYFINILLSYFSTGPTKSGIYQFRRLQYSTGTYQLLKDKSQSRAQRSLSSDCKRGLDAAKHFVRLFNGSASWSP